MRLEVDMAKRNYLQEAWLVLLLALAFGAALAIVDFSLSDRIAQNRLNMIMSRIPGLVPGSSRGEQVEVDGEQLYRAIDDNGEVRGWVVLVSARGFEDRVDMLVGLDAARERIINVIVLDQKETPGVGSRITEKAWLDQFAGKPVNLIPLQVRRSSAEKDNEIEAITGATISSETVATAVNRAVQRIGKLDFEKESQ